MKNKKRILWLLCLLQFILILCGTEIISANPDSTAVVINEVLYDPAGADSGFEFVELYNPTEQPVQLSGFIIETGNGAEVNSWKIGWTGTSSDLIMPNSYFLIGESSVDADAQSTLDLQNGPDSVRLVFNNSVVDLVGYGNLAFVEYFEGSPALDTSEGYSLSRIEGVDSDNNADDFYVIEPSPQKSNSNMMLLQINVENPKIAEISAELEDDDLDTAGIQLMPDAGKIRLVEISVELYEPTGLSNESDVNVLFESESYSLSLVDYNETWQRFSRMIGLDFDLNPGNHTILISASDNTRTSDLELSFEYLPMLAIELDSSFVNVSSQPGSFIEVIGDLDLSTQKSPTLRNIGNVDVEIGVMASLLESESGTISPENIACSLGQDLISKQQLSTQLNYLGQSIAVGTSRELSYEVYVPQETMPGSYAGSIIIGGRSVQ